MIAFAAMPRRGSAMKQAIATGATLLLLCAGAASAQDIR